MGEERLAFLQAVLRPNAKLLWGVRKQIVVLSLLILRLGAQCKFFLGGAILPRWRRTTVEFDGRVLGVARSENLAQRFSKVSRQETARGSSPYRSCEAGRWME